MLPVLPNRCGQRVVPVVPEAALSVGCDKLFAGLSPRVSRSALRAVGALVAALPPMNLEGLESLAIPTVRATTAVSLRVTPGNAWTEPSRTPAVPVPASAFGRGPVNAGSPTKGSSFPPSPGPSRGGT